MSIAVSGTPRLRFPMALLLAEPQFDIPPGPNPGAPETSNFQRAGAGTVPALESAAAHGL